jgi:uncharacterized protein YaaN involved in tellurite resistance
MTTEEKILKTLEDLQAGQKTLQTDIAVLRAGQKTLEAGRQALDLKIEAIHAYQKKAHTEIMDSLFESNETTGSTQKALEKRIERVEKHLGLPPLK